MYYDDADAAAAAALSLSWCGYLRKGGSAGGISKRLRHPRVQASQVRQHDDRITTLLSFTLGIYFLLPLSYLVLALLQTSAVCAWSMVHDAQRGSDPLVLLQELGFLFPAGLLCLLYWILRNGN